MPPSNRKMLYLSADRGLPLGGTKGGSVHIKQFLDHLGLIGWSATVLTTRAESDLSGITAESIHTVPEIHTRQFIATAGRMTDDKSKLKEANDLLRNEAVAESLGQLYNEGPYELIYERYSLFGMAGLTFARQHQLPFVLEVNAPLVLEATRYRELDQSGLARLVEKFLFTSSDHIVAVSSQVRDYILRIAPAAKVTVIPNGFDPLRFSELIEKRTVRIKLREFASEDLVVGFIGAVKPWHGLEGLLQLFEQFHRDKESLRLAIVGDNKHLFKYMSEDPGKIVRDRILVATGPVEFESVLDYLGDMDILVAPYPDLSDFYFSPLKIYEYMASGKPIIASAIGQIKEILTDGETALLVPPGDNEALREAIVRLAGDVSLRKALGQAARRAAFENHTWLKRVKLLEEIMGQLTEGRTNLRETNRAH